MHPAGFQLAISAIVLTQTYALERTATGIVNISQPIRMKSNSTEFYTPESQREMLQILSTATDSPQTLYLTDTYLR
jgi:hypothetical protein